MGVDRNVRAIYLVFDKNTIHRYHRSRKRIKSRKWRFTVSNQNREGRKKAGDTFHGSISDFLTVIEINPGAVILARPQDPPPRWCCIPSCLRKDFLAWFRSHPLRHPRWRWQHRLHPGFPASWRPHTLPPRD